jgi:hypothetical protein
MTKAAAAAFGPTTEISDEQQRQATLRTAPRPMNAAAVTEPLLGLSCAICARGKVTLFPATRVFFQR